MASGIRHESKIVKIDPSMIPYDKAIQCLCHTPFYGHASGCPNFAKKEGCPPKKETIDKIIDFEKDIYIVYTRFCVGEFAERMRRAHPEWKEQEYPGNFYHKRTDPFVSGIVEHLKKKHPGWPEEYFPEKKDFLQGQKVSCHD